MSPHYSRHDSLALSVLPVRMLVLVWVCVLVVVLGVERGHGHHQAPMLHALETDDNIGEKLNARGLAVDDQHFKAGVLVEMRMSGGDHQVMVLVLRLRELLCDAMGVMVVDEGDGADHGCVGRGGPLAHQPVADQVPECFRSVRVAALLYGAVEPLEEIGIEGNADSA